MAGIMEYYPDDFLKIAALLESIYVVKNYKILVIHNSQFIRSISCVSGYIFRFVY
jgi:hypothetical protein